MLIEYAGDVLPSLATAVGGQIFAPYFAGFLPLLLKKTVSKPIFQYLVLICHFINLVAAVVHKQRLNNQILHLFRFLLIHSVRKTVLLGFTTDLYPNLFLRLQIDPVFVDAGYNTYSYNICSYIWEPKAGVEL